MFECPVCGFSLYVPIARLTTSALGLYDDDRFPGRCILAYTQHAEHLETLADSAATALILDVQRAARAIKAVTGADRINVAVLGNAQPHLHVHLIPRRRLDDPVPTRSPWHHPAAAAPLPPEERARIVAAIGAHVGPARP